MWPGACDLRHKYSKEHTGHMEGDKIYTLRNNLESHLFGDTHRKKLLWNTNPGMVLLKVSWAEARCHVLFQCPQRRAGQV